MSFQYHQYVDYSNPTTPRVYNWEVASTTSEQDTTLQLQQDSQQSVQQQQQQQISPSQLQLQQLPPPLLPAHQHQQHQQHSASGSPQEHIHQLQQLQQPQPQLQPLQQQQQQQFVPHHQTIQVAPVQAQPQYRFETVTEEDFIHASATGERPGSSRRRGASKPPLHVDTSRAPSSSAAPAASPGPSGSAHAHSAGGPLRVPHSRAHVQSAHPYRRPQSRAASGSGSGASSGAPPPPGAGVGAQAPVRSRRVSELQSAQTSVGGAPSFAAALPVMPTVGTAMAVSCPAQSSWREGLLMSTNPSFDTEATPTQAGQRLPVPPEPVRRYSIRADVHYSAEENVMTAMFELPGVKKSDVRITMSVCPFSRVRQVSVSGFSRAVLPLQGHSVRERKFGGFFRSLAVPPETRREDISVTFEDGILTLKIPCGTPAEAEQPEDVPIP